MPITRVTITYTIPARVTSKSKDSRMRSTATRRARYGTVTRPTSVAITKDVEARITVVQRFPASRETEEQRAVAKASPKAINAHRNVAQSSWEADWRPRPSRL